MLEQDGKGKGAHFEITQKFLKITNDQPKNPQHIKTVWIPIEFPINSFAKVKRY